MPPGENDPTNVYRDPPVPRDPPAPRETPPTSRDVRMAEKVTVKVAESPPGKAAMAPEWGSAVLAQLTRLGDKITKGNDAIEAMHAGQKVMVTRLDSLEGDVRHFGSRLEKVETEVRAASMSAERRSNRPMSLAAGALPLAPAVPSIPVYVAGEPDENGHRPISSGFIVDVMNRAPSKPDLELQAQLAAVIVEQQKLAAAALTVAQVEKIAEAANDKQVEVMTKAVTDKLDAWGTTTNGKRIVKYGGLLLAAALGLAALRMQACTAAARAVDGPPPATAVPQAAPVR